MQAMSLLFLRSVFVFILVFAISLSLQANEITQHPDFPDRLVQTRDGFTVEYEVGQEALVDAVFLEIEKLREERMNGESETILDREFQDPFSFHDMKPQNPA